MANVVANTATATLSQTAALAGTPLRGANVKSNSFVGTAIRAPVAKRQSVCMAHQEEKKSVKQALTAGALAAVIAISGPAIAVPDVSGTPADPSTVKDDLVGGLTDPASIPGRIKERANIIGEKLSGAKDSAQANAKGTPADPETVKDDAVGGVTDPASIPGRIKERASTIKEKLSGVAFQSLEAPPLTYVTLDAAGTPLDPSTVKDDALGGLTDPASIPGRIKERANIVGSKASQLAGQARLGQSGQDGGSQQRGGKLDGVQLSDRVPQRSAPSYGTPNGSFKGVSSSEVPSLVYVGLSTKGTPLDPDTVKDDLVGGITDPGSIPGRVKERAEIIGNKSSQAKSQASLGQSGADTGSGIRGGKTDGVQLSDRVPQRDSHSYGSNTDVDLSDRLPQKNAPGLGRLPTENTKNVRFDREVPLTYVNLSTKGTPLDPETVKDDAIGGITDPASIPGRIKERANIVGSKASQAAGQARLGQSGGDAGSGVRGGKTDGVQLSDRLPQKDSPGFGRKPVDANKFVSSNGAPSLTYVGLSTKGTPLDPETVKDDAIGGITDPASIPGRVKERANIVGSKASQLAGQSRLGQSGGDAGSGIRGGKTDGVQLSDRLPQKDSPGFGRKPVDATKFVNSNGAPSLTYVGLSNKGTPLDLETVKDDAIGGFTDPASIPGRIKERANIVGSKASQAAGRARLGQSGGGPGSDIRGGKTDGVQLSDRVPQRSAPSYGESRPGKPVDVTQAPPLVYVGLDTKGTPADPETVKDDVVGGLTDPASIPGRVKERANIVGDKVSGQASKLAGDAKDAANDSSISDRVPQKSNPYGVLNPESQKKVDFTTAPPLVYVYEQSSEPKVGSANQTSDINSDRQKRQENLNEQRQPGIVDKRATAYDGRVGDISKQASKLGDLVAQSSGQIRENVKGTPLDPETVKDDAVGGVTDPGSIPSRVQERAETIGSKIFGN